MMKVLVTGSGGFVGSRVADFYRKKYEVWAPSHGELDFCDEECVKKAVKGFRPAVTIHCGAVSDVAACSRNPELSVAVNVRGTQYLAKACAQVGARFVFLSSDQVYFRERKQDESEADFLKAHHEEERPAPLPLYGQHKLLAERCALTEHPDSVILRLTWMYGKLTEAERRRGRSNLWTMLEDAVKNRKPVVFSATDYRGVTDVTEAVRNMEAAWELPAGIYNFGSSNDTNMYETVRRVLAAAGAEELAVKGEGRALRNLIMDTAKLCENGIRFAGDFMTMIRNCREIK